MSSNSEPTTTPLLLKPSAAAQLVGVTPRTLENWRKVDTGPRWVRINGRVMYRSEDIEAWAAGLSPAEDLR